jgi:CheY-like chemotaxis protein
MNDSIIGIVQLHEGVVGATSQGEGKGSTFYVSIPIHRFEDISTRYGIIDGMNSERSSMKSFGDDAGIVSSSPVPDFADAAGFTSSKKRAIAQSSSIAGASLVELTNVGISNQQLVTDTEMQTILSAKRFHSSSIDNDLNLSTSSQQILNFLIVDDSNPNRKVMRRLLNSLGHQVSEAKNGAEFVECMKDFYNSDAERVECPYDIILVDDHMPIMNGPTAIREVRALGFSGIIIGVTGNTEDEDIERFISHGANEVLAKPLNLDTLRTSISALLKR